MYFLLVFQFKYQNIPKSINIYLKSKMTQDIKVLFSEKLSKCSEFSLKTRNKYLPVGSEKESWFPFNLIFLTLICWIYSNNKLTFGKM